MGKRAVKGGSSEEAGSDPAPGCPISKVFYLFGRPYMLDTLYTLITAGKPLRFAEVQAAVPTTASTLSERLKELVIAGLVTRKAFPEVPPRVEYVATPVAMSLEPIFASIRVWAEANPLAVQAVVEPGDAH